ncbi:MAG: hypothetical protein KDD37_00175, partial [Bdellovibrionales bacterium]|nr:hypothetical protein [Bdellovibrionales bacterium]
PNHIIERTPVNGQFESAYHTGSVACAEPVKMAYMLQFKPWKQYYTLDKTASAGHIQNSINTDNLYYKHICFIGDAKSAAEAISSNAEVKTKVLDPYQIQVVFERARCARGTGSYEDFECEEYRNETIEMKLINCNGDGSVDPRSFN